MNAELLAEVLAHPDDDGPRLVLADWLTERGDPRGELIAVQCALEHATDRATRQALELREAELLRAHGPSWVTEHGLASERVKATPHAAGVEHVRGPALAFRRGFPEELKATMRNFVDARDAFVRTPLRGLVLIDGNTADALAEAPPIAALATLRLRDCLLSAAQLAALAASPFLAGVRELVLRRCTVADAGGLGAGALPALRTLEIDECRIDHVDRLAAAPWLPTLETLRFIETYAGNGLRQLLTSRRWRKLSTLVIRGSIPDGDIAAIASSQIAHKLVELEVPHYYVGPATVEAFTRSTKLGKLQRLILRGWAGASDVADLERRWGPKLVKLAR